jgi:hypothetical protein
LIGLLAIGAALAGDVTVAVARLPLPAGKLLDWDDLSTVSLPEALVPATAVVLGAELVGKRLAFPVAQQAPIVAQRLEGYVAPAPEPTEGVVTVEVERDLGAMAALVQAGDEVAWVRTGRDACVLAYGVVVARGAPVRLSVPAVRAALLAAEPDAVAMLRGPEAERPSLSSCEVVP